MSSISRRSTWALRVEEIKQLMSFTSYCSAFLLPQSAFWFRGRSASARCAVVARLNVTVHGASFVSVTAIRLVTNRRLDYGVGCVDNRRCQDGGKKDEKYNGAKREHGCRLQVNCSVVR